MDQKLQSIPNDESVLIVSALRLRIGVVLLFLWWIPFWLLEPLLNKVFGITSTSARHEVLLAIVVVQTVFGLAGLFIAGKQVWALMRHISRRQLPRSVWRMLRYGKIE